MKELQDQECYFVIAGRLQIWSEALLYYGEVLWIKPIEQKSEVLVGVGPTEKSSENYEESLNFDFHVGVGSQYGIILNLEDFSEKTIQLRDVGFENVHVIVLEPQIK